MSEAMPKDVLSGDPAAIEAGLDRWVADLEQNARHYQELQRRVEDVRLSATSADGSVTVTVDADGALVDARFTRRIADVTPEELGRQLLAAVGQARSRIAEQVGLVADETVGGDGARRVTGYYREKFGAPEERPAQRPERRDPDEDVDGSVFH
ncbi:YbaB/EbfC family nucleoid-associated protein [Actinosynnema sp. NPDC020468]|uniref:YbaB/EbfC family nucleoid-associated protein n=1 Tax=Actinosynnema sp. NPDC020468 TaxID=3154488 RepID=UPI0033C79FB3